MSNDSDNERTVKPQAGETKEDPQSFSPEQLKDLSFDQPENFELSEDELARISGGPKGPSWFKLEQAVPRQLDKMRATFSKGKPTSKFASETLAEKNLL